MWFCSLVGSLLKLSFSWKTPILLNIRFIGVDKETHRLDTINFSQPYLVKTVTRCRAPLFKECPQHHGHKGDPGVTPRTCGAISERPQVILVWMRALGRWEHLPRTETRSHKGKA